MAAAFVVAVDEMPKRNNSSQDISGNHVMNYFYWLKRDRPTSVTKLDRPAPPTVLIVLK